MRKIFTLIALFASLSAMAAFTGTVTVSPADNSTVDSFDELSTFTFTFEGATTVVPSEDQFTVYVLDGEMSKIYKRASAASQVGTISANGNVVTVTCVKDSRCSDYDNASSVGMMASFAVTVDGTSYVFDGDDGNKDMILNSYTVKTPAFAGVVTVSPASGQIASLDDISTFTLTFENAKTVVPSEEAFTVYITNPDMDKIYMRASAASQVGTITASGNVVTVTCAKDSRCVDWDNSAAATILAMFTANVDGTTCVFDGDDGHYDPVTVEYKVVPAAEDVVLTFSPASGSKVESLSKIDIEIPEGSTPSGGGYTSAIDVKKNGETVTTCTLGAEWSDSKGGMVYYLTLAAEQTAEGTYTISVPENLIYLTSGKTAAAELTYTIESAIKYKDPVTVSPANESTIEKLSTVVVTFDDAAYDMYEKSDIVVEKYYPTVGLFETVENASAFTYPDDYSIGFKFAEITEAGIYRVTIPAEGIYGINAAGTAIAWYNNKIQLIYTISEPSGITDVKAASSKAYKMIENGQVVIVKDGIKYNVTGQVIK